MMTLINARTGQVVASAVEVARTRADRCRGLLGRDHLDRSAALVLSPCWAIHTAFMRFSIDVMFVDHDGEVVRVVRELGAWRMAAVRRARAVIELSGGSLLGCDIRIGDRLYLLSVSGIGAEPASDVPLVVGRLASTPA